MVNKIQIYINLCLFLIKIKLFEFLAINNIATLVNCIKFESLLYMDHLEPPSLSELTPITFNMKLTHLGSEA